MARSLNSISFTGYLGSDPRIHTFDNGDTVANLSVAIARQKKDPDTGEWIDDTLWVDVKAFGRQAETIGQYLAKGSFVCVTGQLAQPRKWTDDEGNSRFNIVIDHAQVTFGPRVDDNGGNGGQAARQQAQPQQRQAPPAQQAAPAQSNLGAAFADADIPF